MTSPNDNRSLRPHHPHTSPVPRSPTPPSPIFHPTLPSRRSLPTRYMPPPESYSSKSEDDIDDWEHAKRQGFFDDADCDADIFDDEEWDTTEQQNYRPPHPTRTRRWARTAKDAVSNLSEAGSKVSGLASNPYVERATSVARGLVGFDAPEIGKTDRLPAPLRGMREEVLVIVDEPQGIHDPKHLPHSRIPAPLSGLAPGKPEVPKHMTPTQAKLAAVKNLMAADRVKWLERQAKEKKNEERENEYQELQKKGRRPKRQDIGPNEEEEWTTQKVRGVPLHPPTKATIPTEPRTRKHSDYARQGRKVDTFRPEQGLDIAAINEQIRRGDMPIIGDGKSLDQDLMLRLTNVEKVFDPVRDYWASRPDGRPYRRYSSDSD